MIQPDDLRCRLEGIKKRLEALYTQLASQQEDGTLVVDAADLDAKCRRFRDQLDKLLELPSNPEIDDGLGKLLIALSISIDDLAACCADLKGPLGRLISAVYDRLPDDPNHADDAT